MYVDKSADLQMAIDLVVNAKMRRTGICGAAETLLIDREVADSHMKPILEALKAAECELRLDHEGLEIFHDGQIAQEDDWSTEYLDAIISARLVDGISGAIAHINKYSSSHTECIIAEDGEVIDSNEPMNQDGSRILVFQYRYDVSFYPSFIPTAGFEAPHNWRALNARRANGIPLAILYPR